MQKSASLTIVSKKERFGAIEITADEVEMFLKEQLNLKILVGTRIRNKFNADASSCVSVIEEEFPLSKTRVFYLRNDI
jgi:hypothetical protein